MKHLQHVSGVRPSAYWLSTLTIDALHCAIVITIVVILFAAFQLEEFSGEGLAAVTVVMVKVTCTCNSSPQYLVYVCTYDISYPDNYLPEWSSSDLSLFIYFL